ncbi:hypothetical protein TrLO_g458 [Triparma laevis f. longispina]|uniref:Uncharacterized protein n=1 Tax=Triparma laevis f. longispina TaxID=1714387 RepID=A0A9W7FK83_9STRA|nr:hypothetical protein TrLO_g458 [Triparma laevis f. longispina]
MFIPDSFQKLGYGIFQMCSMLVPSNYDPKSNFKDCDAVVAYLRWKQMPITQACIEGDIEAIKKIVTDNPEAPFEKHTTTKETPFHFSLDKPLLVKITIQTSPDATIDSKTPLAYAKEKNASQLTIEMLELLTADEMKVCGDTETDIQAAIDEKEATLNDNKSAMANIVYYIAREKATVLQTKMFGELGAADVASAQATVNQLKVFCGDQAKRLGDLIAMVMNKYKTTDPRGYEPFEQVKDIEVKEQTTPPSALPLPEQVKFQLVKATWYEDNFQAAMSEIAAVFNASKSCEEIYEHYEIDNSDGKWSKELRAEVFNLDSTTDEVMEQGKTLRDLNRVTFEFEDPLLMALCFEILNKKYNIYGLKNKYLQETFKEPPNLHMNLEIKDGWLCEGQMLFRDVLLIKKELHKFYDVNRADGSFVVAGRLFKSLADPNEKQPDDVDNKNDANVNTESKINSLKRVAKAKDAELKSTKSELGKEIETLQARIRSLEKQVKEQRQERPTDAAPSKPPQAKEQSNQEEVKAKPVRRKLKKSRK